MPGAGTNHDQPCTACGACIIGCHCGTPSTEWAIVPVCCWNSAEVARRGIGNQCQPAYTEASSGGGGATSTKTQK
eukprot:3124628-Amphidinium_carterae.1